MAQDMKKSGNTAMGFHEESTIVLSRRYVLKAAFAGVMAGLAVPPVAAIVGLCFRSVRRQNPDCLFLPHREHA